MDTPLTREYLDETLDRRFEDFARIVAEGFAQTSTKEDLKQFATKEDMGKLKHDLMDFTDRRVEKLRFDIQGDIVTQSRKEDTKLITLIEILKEKNVISDKDVHALLSMEPFPRSMV